METIYINNKAIKGEVLETVYCANTLDTRYLVFTPKGFYVLRRNAFDETYKYFIVLKTNNKPRALGALYGETR